MIRKGTLFGTLLLALFLYATAITAKEQYGQETPIPYLTFRNVFNDFLQQITGKDLHISIVGKAAVEDIMALLKSNPKYKYRIAEYQFKSASFRLETEDLIPVLDIVNKKYPIHIVRYWDSAEQVHRYERTEAEKSYAISIQILEKLYENAKTDTEKMNIELQRQTLIRDKIAYEQFASLKKAQIEYSQIK